MCRTRFYLLLGKIQSRSGAGQRLVGNGHLLCRGAEPLPRFKGYQGVAAWHNVCRLDGYWRSGHGADGHSLFQGTRQLRPSVLHLDADSFDCRVEGGVGIIRLWQPIFPQRYSPRCGIMLFTISVAADSSALPPLSIGRHFRPAIADKRV